MAAVSVARPFFQRKVPANNFPVERGVPILLSDGSLMLVSEQDVERVAEINWHRRQWRNHAYAKATIPPRKSSEEFAHRFILGLRHGDGFVVDHINGDTLDNRRSNLRICTQADNARNALRRKPSRCGYIGVHKVGAKFQAKVTHDGRQYHLGLFETDVEAAAAVNEALDRFRGAIGPRNVISTDALRAALEGRRARLMAEVSAIDRRLAQCE